MSIECGNEVSVEGDRFVCLAGQLLIYISCCIWAICENVYVGHIKVGCIWVLRTVLFASTNELLCL